MLPRAEHGISRANISESALKVLYRLKDAGYQAFMVGGGVRDLMLGREPKDFDVATDASPEQVRQLFRNSRLIGRRFRLAHVRFGREIVEVATFRGAHNGADDGTHAEIVDGRIVRDNVFGTIEEDAVRRDFTVNALYYDIRDFSVVDYVGALGDLHQGTLRLIGDPWIRYREDPVRMLRAVRFAAKLGFKIHSESEQPLRELGGLLEAVAPARLFEEILKLFHGGSALETFELLRHYGLLQHLFPATEQVLARQEQEFPRVFIAEALKNTDVRVNSGQPVTPAFLYAALLWEPLRSRMARLQTQNSSDPEALQIAADEVIAAQIRHTALPRRFSIPMREIWALQGRLERRGGRRALRLLSHPRFRAAYDFLCLRASVGEASQVDCDWWTHLQEASPEEQQRMIAEAPAGKRRSRRRRNAARRQANA